MADNSEQVSQLKAIQLMANRQSGKATAPVVQRAAVFEKTDELEWSLEDLHDLLEETSAWYRSFEPDEAWEWLQDFAADTDKIYQVDENHVSELEEDLMAYVEFFEDDYDDGYDPYDEFADDFLDKYHKGKPKKQPKQGSDGKSRRREENSLKSEEGPKVPEYEPNVGERFEAAAKKAQSGMSTGGKQESDTRFAEILSYSEAGLSFESPQKFSSGKPGGGFTSMYGLVPTERGDFTKLQYGILNDVVYKGGSTAVLVEWSNDVNANKAQYLKINSLIKTLSTFAKKKGKLIFFAILNTVDKFNDATLANYLLDKKQSPVLSGGEAFDKEIYDKGRDFWKKHGRSLAAETTPDTDGRPYLVVWFNRSNVQGQYNVDKGKKMQEEEDRMNAEEKRLKEENDLVGQEKHAIARKAFEKRKNAYIKQNDQLLRELRHKTNAGTMARIIHQYRDDRRIVFAGDKGADKELGIKPDIDLRESWKLPGQKTILSQDETFFKLAATSGKEVLHIGFRSGRLESLVMQPMQRVVMLENKLSETGNIRAKRYYAYSGRGAVFNPKKFQSLHVAPDTVALAGHLKSEEKQAKDPQRYGIPFVPVPFKKKGLNQKYYQYLSALDKLVNQQETSPDMDDALKEMIEKMKHSIEGELISVELDWTMTMTNQTRGRGISELKKGFKYLVNKYKNDLVDEIRESVSMRRADEIKTVGAAIFNTVSDKTDELDNAGLSNLVVLGGIDAVKHDLKRVIEVLKAKMLDTLSK